MMHIRPLTNSDLPAGLHLSQQAGWNQLDLDWRRGLDLAPNGCFVALWDGSLVGTVTTCIFGKVAWIAMMLVDPRFRRRGIGQALMEQALTYLDEQSISTVRLDATPMGEPLYRRLGFVAQFRLARFAGTLPADASAPSSTIVSVPPPRWPELFTLDERVTRTNRRNLLERLFAERPTEVRGIEGTDGWRGFVTTRAGRQARLLGPCLGEAGGVLLEDACRRHAGHMMYIDVPEANRPAVVLAEARGLTVQRHLLRMYRGEEIVEQTDLLFASSGPEKG